MKYLIQILSVLVFLLVNWFGSVWCLLYAMDWKYLLFLFEIILLDSMNLYCFLLSIIAENTNSDDHLSL